MTRNYQLAYYVAENVGIKGILAYPKIILMSMLREIKFVLSRASTQGQKKSIRTYFTHKSDLKYFILPLKINFY